MTTTVRLTQEQDALARHFTGPGMGLAVAGAGKTTALLLRIANLIRVHGVQAHTVLMATFSKRGAADMRRRASALCVPAGVEYRTLHSVAFEYLRTARTRRRCEVAKEWMLSRIIRDELKRLARQGATELPKPGDIAKEIGLAKAALIWPTISNGDGFLDGAWTKPGCTVCGGTTRVAAPVEQLPATFDAYTQPERTATPETVPCGACVFPAYREWAVTRMRAPLDDVTADIVDGCYREWEMVSRAPETLWEDKAATRLVTFDDMLAIVARDILLGRGWTAEFRGAYQFVQVDEVQDNNLAQWVLVEHIVQNRNLLVVGDDQQSIFGFRGARPALMREFLERHASAPVYKLTFNFRCGQTILDAANGVLAHAEDRLYEGDLQRGRGPEAVGFVRAQGFHDPETEAKAVIESIETSIKNEGQNPDEVAILYRLNALSGPLEVECIRRGILYKIAGSSFFSRGEIKAAVGYIGVALDDADETSFKACYAVPGGRYLGNEFLRSHPSLKSARVALSSGELGGRGRGGWGKGVRDIVRVVDEIRNILNRVGTADSGIIAALEYIFEDVGVREYFRDEGADAEEVTEVEAACDALVTCAGTIGDPGALVNYARQMCRVGYEDVGSSEGERTMQPRITLSSCHKAKGLEWERVFVVGMTEGTFPFIKAPLAEERRLGYVAMTRARDHLWVSWTEGGESGHGPSCLVGEAKLLPTREAPAAAV